jgi:protein TBF1
MVVDYADKYGINIPLSQEDTAAPEDHEQHQEHNQFDLASLLQSNLAQTGLLKDMDTGNFLDDIPSSFNPSLDLTKLIERSLSSHNVEAGDEAMGHDPSNDAADSGIPKDLASLISEKLAGSLDKMTEVLPHAQPSYSASTHDLSHGEYLGQGMTL